MSAAALLREAQEIGLRLRAEGHEIRLSAAEAPSPELLARLRGPKADGSAGLSPGSWRRLREVLGS